MYPRTKNIEDSLESFTGKFALWWAFTQCARITNHIRGNLYYRSEQYRFFFIPGTPSMKWTHFYSCYQDFFHKLFDAVESLKSRVLSRLHIFCRDCTGIHDLLFYLLFPQLASWPPKSSQILTLISLMKSCILSSNPNRNILHGPPRIVRYCKTFRVISQIILQINPCYPQTYLTVIFKNCIVFLNSCTFSYLVVHFLSISSTSLYCKDHQSVQTIQYQYPPAWAPPCILSCYPQVQRPAGAPYQ